MRVVLFALVVSCSACGSATPTTPDAGSADSGADARAPCDTMFVAPTGADGATGCEPARAKRTIGAALLAAQGSAKIAHVKVCKGNYGESVSFAVQRTLTLEGGFACDTFERTAKYGYPTFDGVNETVVQSDGSAFTATGAVPSTVVVDGFTFRGSDLDNSPAVKIEDGPALVLSNDRIVGGKGTGYGVGSTGVDVRRAPIELVHDDIDGGAGTTDTFHLIGSMGVFAEGPVRIHDDRIAGGSGVLGGDEKQSLPIASVAMRLYGDDYVGPAAIARNVIDAGAGTTKGTTPVQVAGIQVWRKSDNSEKRSVEIVDNVIRGRSGDCTGPCGSSAVDVSWYENAVIARNRIHGGDTGHLYANAGAILVYVVANASIVDNLIHAGGRSPLETNAAVAISMAYGGFTRIAHNSIVAPASKSGVIAFAPTSAPQTFSVENNLILSTGSGTLFSGPRCNGLDVVRNNAFAGFATLFTGRGVLQACSATIPSTTVTELETNLATDGATASGNLELHASCATASCVAVPACAPNDAHCAEGVFAGFGASDLGVSALFGGGWPLASSPSCKLSKGGMDLTASVPADFVGKLRTVPVSLGAYEEDGACQP